MAGTLLPWASEIVVADMAQIRKPDTLRLDLHLRDYVFNPSHVYIVSLLISSAIIFFCQPAIRQVDFTNTSTGSAPTKRQATTPRNYWYYADLRG
jgi:hypothetical protein